MWHVALMYLWVNGRFCLVVTVIGYHSRCIVRREPGSCMQDREAAETIAVASEQAPGKSPGVVRNSGSQFVAKEWLHSALKYLPPIDHHGGSLETLLANKKELSKWGQLTGFQTELYCFSITDLSEDD